MGGGQERREGGRVGAYTLVEAGVRLRLRGRARETGRGEGLEMLEAPAS